MLNLVLSLILVMYTNGECKCVRVSELIMACTAPLTCESLTMLKGKSDNLLSFNVFFVTGMPMHKHK